MVGNQPASASRKGRAVWWTKWAIAIAIAGLVMGKATPSFAAGDSTVAVQRLGPPKVEARRKALLRQMLAWPADLDLAFGYATLSSQVGDYEGAVSMLERMLIYAPNTPRLELGILYYRLGAYDVARSYFGQALANPSIPPSVAAQVRLYLQQLAIAADPPVLLDLDLLGDPLGDRLPGNMFVVSDPGAAVKRITSAADINSLPAAVSG
jgi:tetratricopeptide (TPR) repeat protein